MKAFLPPAFIILSAGALLFAISFVWASLRSLLGGTPESQLLESSAMRQRHELLDEKEAVLKSLKDLEFERDVGKLSDEDFKRLEAEFRAKARRILRELDSDLTEHRERALHLLEHELDRKLELAQPGHPETASSAETAAEAGKSS